MTSPIAKKPVTEGSPGGHTIKVTMGGPAVEGYTRAEFMRDLKKVSRKLDPERPKKP
jgi:hypothetical protein